MKSTILVLASILIGCFIKPNQSLNDRTWWQKMPHGGFSTVNWSSTVTPSSVHSDGEFNTTLLSEPVDVSVQTSASAPRAYRKVKKTFRSLQYRQSDDRPPQIHKTSWSQEELSRLTDHATPNELDRASQAKTVAPIIENHNDVFGPTGKVHWDDEKDYGQTVAPQITSTSANRRSPSTGHSSALPLPPPNNRHYHQSRMVSITTASPLATTTNRVWPQTSVASSNQAYGSKLSPSPDLFPTTKSTSKPAGRRRAATLTTAVRAPHQTVNFQMQIQHQPKDVATKPVSSGALVIKSRSGKVLSGGFPLKPPKLDHLLAGFMKNNPLVIPLGKRVYTIRKKSNAADGPVSGPSTAPPSSATTVSRSPVWGNRVVSNKKIARFGQLREIESDSVVTSNPNLLPQQKSAFSGADLRNEYERNVADIRNTRSETGDVEDDGPEHEEDDDSNSARSATLALANGRNAPTKQLPVQIISWRQAIRHRGKTHDSLRTLDRFDASDVQKHTTLAADDESSGPEVLSFTTPSYGLRSDQNREPITTTAATTRRPASARSSPINQPYIRPLTKSPRTVFGKFRATSNFVQADLHSDSEWTSIKAPGNKLQSGNQNLIKKSLRVIDTVDPSIDETDEEDERSDNDVSILNNNDRNEEASNDNIGATALIPKTGFSCETHLNAGYYADVEANCEVFHVCQADRRKHSFFCPPGTAFNQRLLVCDWKNSVECATSGRHFPTGDETSVSSSIVSTVASVDSAIEQPDEDLRK